MAGFERTTWIDKSPAEIFATVTDTKQAPKIVRGVTKMEKITEGPVRAGTQFRETRIVNGQEATAVLNVVVCEPGQKYSVSNETNGIVVTYHYTFIPENDGTRVNLVCDVKASGLKKVMIPVVTAVMRKEDGDHLENLKAVLEANGGKRSFG